MSTMLTTYPHTQSSMHTQSTHTILTTFTTIIIITYPSTSLRAVAQAPALGVRPARRAAYPEGVTVRLGMLALPSRPGGAAAPEAQVSLQWRAPLSGYVCRSIE